MAVLRHWALITALTLLGVPAAAAGSVALVLEVAGGTEPALEPFSEMTANQSVDLVDQATVTLLHYGTCEEVVVRGGRLVVTERQYLTQKGEGVLKVTRAKCPKRVALAGEARTGGVRLRAGSSGLQLNPRPSFVVVGPNRPDVVEVAVRRGETKLGAFRLDGPRFSWPADAASLAPGRDYSLQFSRRDGQAGEPIAFEVREGEQALALIEAN
jgi:hypothetical protein